MSNKYDDHLQVLVEDDANRQLINGLNQHPSLRMRRLQVFPPLGGWKVVLDTLTDPVRLRGMEDYAQRHLLLLIDFDEKFDDRWSIYEEYKANMSQNVSSRIYLLGCMYEPEQLKADLKHRKSLEKLGRELSQECPELPAESLWQHAHLKHNAPELQRLIGQVNPFLFA